MSELEAPGAEFKISAANRQAVKDWLAAQGFDATRVQSMRDQTLLKAYTDPRYLRALRNRGDYNPSVERNGNGQSEQGEAGLPRGNSTAGKDAGGGPLAHGGGDKEAQSESIPRNGACEPQPLNSMAEVGLATAPAGPENTQPLTEARVIELIRALAVLKLEGLEDLL